MTPIVDGRVRDSSYVEVVEFTDLLERTTIPSVVESIGKGTETPNLFENADVDVIVDNSEEGDVNVSSVGDTVTDVGDIPSVTTLLESYALEVGVVINLYI
ncbi:hypothetical protein LIER_27622 [Lithospermum erythrorhizon]|uniref:Uncharacterized protein n=1 Tax=Lithospermum erythrorhizon TaxID=34254 RepID=A0AAV3RCP0_LITER